MRRDALIVAAFLLALIVVELMFPIRAPFADFKPASAAGDALSRELSTVEIPEPPAIEHYAAMLQRPLFIESRRVPGEAPGSTSEITVQAVGQPTFKVTGIIREPNATYAMIVSPKKGAVSSLVKVGDTRDGWKVEEISDDRLVVVSGTDRQELLLRSYKPVQPTVSKRPARAAKKPQSTRKKAAAARKANASKGKKIRNKLRRRDK